MELQQSFKSTQDDLETHSTTLDNLILDLENQLENQEDINISTLPECIKALGGNLKIVADLPNV